MVDESFTGVNELELPSNTITNSGSQLTVNYTQPLAIKIFDVVGRNAAEYKFEAGKTVYDLSGLQHGLYLVEVSEKKQRKTYRLIF